MLWLDIPDDVRRPEKRSFKKFDQCSGWNGGKNWRQNTDYWTFAGDTSSLGRLDHCTVHQNYICVGNSRRGNVTHSLQKILYLLLLISEVYFYYIIIFLKHTLFRSNFMSLISGACQAAKTQTIMITSKITKVDHGNEGKSTHNEHHEMKRKGTFSVCQSSRGEG